MDTISGELGYRQKPGLSGTQLVKLARSPAHYKYSVEHPTEPTTAMEFGTAAHKLVLETESFDNDYAIYRGEGTRASKEYKEFAAGVEGKKILKADEYECLQGMLTALKGHTLARRLLFDEAGHNEHELFWTDEDVLCKGKLDRYLIELNIVVDYKTASDASESAFNSWKAKSMGYYLQAAHYQAGLRVDGVVPAFIFVVQETEAPYGVQVYELDQVSIDAAHEQRKQLLGVYKECMASGVWRSYEETIKKI